MGSFRVGSVNDIPPGGIPASCRARGGRGDRPGLTDASAQHGGDDREHDDEAAEGRHRPGEPEGRDEQSGEDRRRAEREIGHRVDDGHHLGALRGSGGRHEGAEHPEEGGAETCSHDRDRGDVGEVRMERQRGEAERRPHGEGARREEADRPCAATLEQAGGEDAREGEDRDDDPGVGVRDPAELAPHEACTEGEEEPVGRPAGDDRRHAGREQRADPERHPEPRAEIAAPDPRPGDGLRDGRDEHQAADEGAEHSRGRVGEEVQEHRRAERPEGEAEHRRGGVPQGCAAGREDGSRSIISADITGTSSPAAAPCSARAASRAARLPAPQNRSRLAARETAPSARTGLRPMRSESGPRVSSTARSAKA